MFASKVTDTVTLSNGTDTVVIKKLGYKAQEAAAGERQRLGIQTALSYGPGFAEMQKKAIEAQGGLEAVLAKVEADPFLKFDKGTLLEKGIVSWSLSDTPTVDEMDDLDPADADLIARKVYDLFRPKTDAERKND
jgi:hypothetical protein